MIQEHELIPLLVQCIPEYRNRLAKSADTWLNDDGTVSIYQQLYVLVDLVVDRFDAGNYDGSDELFELVERLFAEAEKPVKDAIATGFLEGMQNQTRLPGDLWAPLTGQRAKEFCRAIDVFHGAKTSGLYEVDIDTR